jgi:SAM-dependent methyltransferase
MTKENKMRILDVGCGQNKTEGATGIDQRELPGVDIVHDVNVLPWPLPGNSFDRIVCSHVIEHLNDIPAVMGEIHRVAKPGAEVFIRVPHFSYINAYRDPTHLHYLSLQSFDVFCEDGRYPQKNMQFQIVKRNLTFSSSLLDIPGRIIFRLNPRRYERRFAWIFPAREITVTLAVIKDGKTE